MIRTPRTLEKTCHCCRRPGWLVKEHFSLRTEEEQMALFGYIAKRGEKTDQPIPADAELCWAGAGSTIGECIKEGIEIATAMQKRVAFVFNERTVVVNQYTDADVALRDWWQRAYNETPEESFAKR